MNMSADFKRCLLQGCESIWNNAGGANVCSKEKEGVVHRYTKSFAPCIKTCKYTLSVVVDKHFVLTLVFSIHSQGVVYAL